MMLYSYKRVKGDYFPPRRTSYFIRNGGGLISFRRAHMALTTSVQNKKYQCIKHTNIKHVSSHILTRFYNTPVVFPLLRFASSPPILCLVVAQKCPGRIFSRGYYSVDRRPEQPIRTTRKLSNSTFVVLSNGRTGGRATTGTRSSHVIGPYVCPLSTACGACSAVAPSLRALQAKRELHAPHRSVSCRRLRAYG